MAAVGVSLNLCPISQPRVLTPHRRNLRRKLLLSDAHLTNISRPALGHGVRVGVLRAWRGGVLVRHFLLWGSIAKEAYGGASSWLA